MIQENSIPQRAAGSWNMKAYEFYKKAEEALSRGNYQESIDICLKAFDFKDDTINAAASRTLAMAYEKMADIEKAIEWYEKFERLSPAGIKSAYPPRSVVLRRTVFKKNYSAFLDGDDLPSLIELEKMYARRELMWHWAELKDFSDKFKKHKDFQRALTWISTAIDARMRELSEEIDSSLASLYAAKGFIFFSMKEYAFALLEFLVALRHYNWSPTKTLSMKINSTLKKAGLSDADFINAVEKTKKDGLLEGLKQLKQLTNII